MKLSDRQCGSQPYQSSQDDWHNIKSLADHLLSETLAEKRALKRRVRAITAILKLCKEEFTSKSSFIGTAPLDERQYEKSVHLVCKHQKASTRWLQRKLGVGYQTSARLIAAMERNAIIGPPNHVGYREVFRDEKGNII